MLHCRRLLCLVLVLCLLPLTASAQEEYSDREMMDAFVGYMNEKAAAIGMDSSKFYDPIGMNNFTTARDFLKLMLWADQYWDLAPVWGAAEKTVEVQGEKPRQQTVTSTIRGSEFLDPYYEILGCKDGEFPDKQVRNLAVILQIPDSDERLAVVVLCAYGHNGLETGSRAVAKKAADLALARYADPAADLSGETLFCQSAMVALIPAEGADFDNIQILYEKDPDRQFMTASIAKVLTAVCVLDIQRDLEKSFTYCYMDTNIGGFYAQDFFPGDEMTLREGLYALLLPSSNVTARALARESGALILAEGSPDPTQIPRPVPKNMTHGCIAAAVTGLCAAGKR